MTSHLLPSDLQRKLATTRGHTVSFVLPAFNEEENITKAVQSAVAVETRWCAGFEVIVVDDGSSDRTAELVRGIAARNPEVRLVQHTHHMGYGHALRSGFSAATRDFVFYTDADKKRVIYQPVTIEPRVLVPKVIRYDHRYEPALKDAK